LAEDFRHRLIHEEELLHLLFFLPYGNLNAPTIAVQSSQKSLGGSIDASAILSKLLLEVVDILIGEEALRIIEMLLSKDFSRRCT